MLTHTTGFDTARREFISNSLLSLGAITLSAVPGSTLANPFFENKPLLTVQDVINLILKAVSVPPIADTIDTIKFGDTSQPVTGIVCTMFPTVAVIEEAVRRKANLVIVHEPTFFNGLDRTEKLAINDIMERKKALLQKNKIVVWRFHDYAHAVKPDMIIEGVIRKMNWVAYHKNEGPFIDIPALSLGQLVEGFKTKLGISHVRIIGDMSKQCSSIALLPGAWGVQKHIETVETNNPDVLVVGELVEWETAEYFRDAIALGKQTALVILGHSVSEEPGMAYFTEWLAPKLQGIPISHCASNDPFTWL